jgi:competence protein ComEA
MGKGWNRAVPLVVFGVIAVIIGGSVGWLRRPSAPQLAGSLPTTTLVEDRETIAVHVAGWVVSPGVVTLTPEAIVADAVAAAGGLLPGASTGALNLAAPVGDGDQVVVPGPGADDELSDPGGDTGPISINQATASDLETLPGLGPVLAERIIAFREDNGPFETVEDLLEVPGIGEAKLASLRDLVKP